MSEQERMDAMAGLPVRDPEVEALRARVQPIVDAATATHPMLKEPAGVRLPLMVEEARAIQRATMLVVAQAQADALRGAACRCYDGQTNATSYVCGTHKNLAAVEALVAELEKGEQP